MPPWYPFLLIVNDPILSARGIRKQFFSLFRRRQTVALDDVSCEISGGESVALVGLNGSGKSTFLRILAGLETPDAGVATIFGHAAGTRAACQRIGYCPEDMPFPADFIVKSSLEDMARLSGIRGAGIRKRTDEMLSQFGLGEKARTRVGSLSRGQTRRLAIAQACIHDPEILLLDEPTSGLDAPGILLFHDYLQSAAARGHTVFMASHVESDILEACGRIIVLDKGRKVLDEQVGQAFADSGRERWTVRNVTSENAEAATDALEKAGVQLDAREPARIGLGAFLRKWLKP